MTRDTRAAYRRRAADTERMIDESVAAVKAERDADLNGRRERAATERARIAALPPVDPSLMVPGVLVGDRRGRVGAVVRVNARTVTVRAGVLEQRLTLSDVVHIAGGAA